MCSATTWRQFFLIEQIFVKRRSFESKSLFFDQKSFKKELLSGKYFVTKKYVLSKKKTEKEEVLSERIFTFMPVVLKKRLFLTFQKFKILYLIFNLKKRHSKMCSDRTSSFWPKNTRKHNFSENREEKGFLPQAFFFIQIERETVVMTSHSQKFDTSGDFIEVNNWWKFRLRRFAAVSMNFQNLYDFAQIW